MRKRWLVAIVAMLMVVALVAAVNSTVVLRGVAGVIPGLAFEGLDGSLAAGIRADRAWWSRGGTTVAVEGLVADWEFLPALVGRIHLTTLQADSVDVVRTDAGPQERGSARTARGLPSRLELPVHLRVDRLEVRGFTLRRGEEVVLAFESIDGTGLVYAADGFAVERFTADGERVGIELGGSLEPRGRWPLRIDARWRASLADRPRLTGTLEASGELDGRIATHASARGAGSADWSGFVEDAFTAPRAEGALVLREAELAPRTRVTANLRLDGWIAALGFRGDVAVTYGDNPRVNANLAGRWGRDLVVIRESTLGADGIAGTLAVTGRYDWSQVPETGVANLTWRGLRAPFGDGAAELRLDAGVVHARAEGAFGEHADGRVGLMADLDLPDDAGVLRGRARLVWAALEVAAIRSESGSVEVTGTSTDWAGTVSSSVEFGPLEPLSFVATVNGGRDWLRADRFEGDWLDGRLAGQVALEWSDAIEGEADLRLTGIDPGRIAERWRGRIGGRLRGSVKPGAAGVDWRARLDEATGELRSMPFAATVELEGTGATVERIDASASIGETEVVARGRIGDTLDLAWSLSAPDLGRLDPRLAGRIEGEGRFAGTRESPSVTFDFESASVAFEGYGVESASGKGTLDLRGAGDSDFSISVNGVRAGERTIESARVSVVGPRDDMRITASASANDAGLGFALAGAWRDSAFSGRLSGASITREGFPPWTLVRAVDLTISRDVFRIERACWSQQGVGNRACLQGAWRAGSDASVAASLVALPLDRLSAWLPTGFGYEGDLSGDASLEWRAGSPPEIEGRLAATPGAWRQVVRGEPVALLAWREATVEGGFRDGTAHARMRFALEDGGELDADLEIPAFDNAIAPAVERPLRARVIGEFSDFDLLPAFVPDVGSVSGRVRADLTVTGTPNDPLIGGTVVIEDGTTTIPRLGLRLTGLQLAVDGGRESVGVRAEAHSGDGAMVFDGRFAIRDGDLAGEGTLNGENFMASNIPEARVAVSPAVVLKVDGHSVRVDGTIGIPFARIEPRDLTGVVAVSSDQVIVDHVGESGKEERWRIGARVRMTMGDVRFDGFGLSAKITGALTAIDEPEVPTRATGELQIEDGLYAAWGQRLEIERGRLVFTGGPITEPGLDIRATRRPDEDILVGVNIRGTLREPELRLFSEPSMQQSEQLSWLVLGIPLAQSGGSEQALLDNTANTAGLAGGEMVLRELGRRLGIGEIGIDRGDTPEQAELVIGRYLSPRFYIAYGIGIFDPSNSVRLRYHIDRRWSIEAESGQEATSADLLYSIER